jgi:hypothetical protein
VIVSDEGSPADITKNQLTFSGSMTMNGLEALPPSFGDLLSLGGSILLVPQFGVTFTGGSGIAGGTMAAAQFTFTGNTGLQIGGSVIGLEDRPLSHGGSGSMTIVPSTWAGMPSGLEFKDYTRGFRPDFGSYREVNP